MFFLEILRVKCRTDHVHKLAIERLELMMGRELRRDWTYSRTYSQSRLSLYTLKIWPNNQWTRALITACQCAERSHALGWLREQTQPAITFLGTWGVKTYIYTYLIYRSINSHGECVSSDRNMSCLDLVYSWGLSFKTGNSLNAYQEQWDDSPASGYAIFIQSTIVSRKEAILRWPVRIRLDAVW